MTMPETPTLFEAVRQFLGPLEAEYCRSERREVSDVHRRLLKAADRIITEVFSDLNAEECARALRRATPVSDTGGPFK